MTFYVVANPERRFGNAAGGARRIQAPFSLRSESRVSVGHPFASFRRESIHQPFVATLNRQCYSDAMSSNQALSAGASNRISEIRISLLRGRETLARPDWNEQDISAGVTRPGWNEQDIVDVVRPGWGEQDVRP
jgi:hypothetical protein